jgi:uncharacterized protein (TIGR03435 family)
MNRFSLRSAILFMALAGIASAAQDPQPGGQLPAAKPRLAFEVISIKPTAQEAPLRFLPGGQTLRGAATLRTIIRLMYDVRESQVEGGPDWTDKDIFEINAKAEHPSSAEELHEMVYNMLADRFKLKYRRETRTGNVLALVVEKPGKLKVSETAGDQVDIRPIKPVGPLKFQGTNASMQDLCGFISRWVDRPVINKTGLDGFYDFTLAFIPEEGMFKLPPGVQTPDYPGIYQAVKEQLGLKLESQKGPVQMLVIDHAEKPKDN